MLSWRTSPTMTAMVRQGCAGPVDQLLSRIRNMRTQSGREVEFWKDAGRGGITLLSWVHPGFSVFAGPPVDAAAVAALESQSRYITRPALAMDALEKLDDGMLALKTPPDSRTGATRVVLDPLEWIHRITAHIPDPGSHCQRFYGAYSNRGRVLRAPARADNPTSGIPAGERDNSDFSREARSTWARLVRKIFEADPLTCGACGSRMRIVDRILRYRQSDRCRTENPFESRDPPLSRPHALH